MQFKQNYKIINLYFFNCHIIKDIQIKKTLNTKIIM